MAISPTVSPDAFDRFSGDPVAGMLDLLSEQSKSGIVGGFMNVCTVWGDKIESYTAGIIEQRVAAPMAR